MKTLRIFTISAISLFLMGCATIHKKEIKEQALKPIDFTIHQMRLASLTNFANNSAVSVKFNNQTTIVYVDWQQKGANFDLNLVGPLNINATRIVGTKNKVMMAEKNGHSLITARSAEELVKKEFGFYLPISNLSSWIKGMPVNAETAKFSIDGQERISELFENGWQINYQNYAASNAIDLPNKILLVNPTLHLTIKIVIRQWLLPKSLVS